MARQLRYNRFITALFLGFMVFSCACLYYLYATRPKVAFVRSLELVYEYNGMRDAHAGYKEKIAQWQANVDTLESQYAQQKKELESLRKKGNRQEIETMELLIRRMEQDLKNYTSVVQEQSREEEQTITQGVLNQINSKIEEYGKENGYDIILGAEGTGNVLYGAAGLDITAEILELLNQEYRLLPQQK